MKFILFHVPPATFSLVNVLSDAAIVINRSWNLSIVPVRHLMPTNTMLLCLWKLALSERFSQWSHTACDLFFLVAFTRLNNLMVHQCPSIYDSSFILIARLIFHCVAVSQSVHQVRALQVFPSLLLMHNAA